MDATQPPIDPEVPEGSRVFKNGVVQGPDGKIVKGQQLTHEQAQSMANARWERHRQGVEDGLNAKLGPNHSRAIGERLGHIIDKGQDRDSLKAIDSVGAILRPDPRVADMPGGDGISIAGNIPIDALPDLLAALVALRNGTHVLGDTITVEAREVPASEVTDSLSPGAPSQE
jgi:hypothetical protein